MAEVTVKQLADVVGTPVERLLEQLHEAGVKKANAADLVSDSEKQQLLTHLRRSHGDANEADNSGSTKKITLRRKRVSEIKVDGAKGKTVNVEVRGKRTYVKRPAEEVEAPKNALQELERKEREAKEAEQRRLEAEAALRAEEGKKAESKSTKQPEAAKPAKPAKSENVVESVSEAADSGNVAIVESKIEASASESPEAKLADVQAATATAASGHKTKSNDRGRKSVVDSYDAIDDARGAAPATTGRKKRPSGKAAATGAKPGAAKPGASKPGVNSKPGANTKSTSRRSGGKSRGGKGRSAPVVESKHSFAKPTAPVVHTVDIPDTITVADLANRMAVKAGEVIKTMMGMGVMATINQVLDQETAVLVVEEMGHTPNMQSENEIEDQLTRKVLSDGDFEAESRPPVVTIMGHVDHGKTSLLDYIRRTRVTAGEAGGITQHIGAYHVETDHGVITFLDTPGHAAFTAMRSRGAQSTDIVVLVVAADDGVMPQTIEAIQHAKAAEVPLVIAVNKMDKPSADPDRVTNELAQHEIMPEEWGGEHQFVHVSALKGDGVDKLLEALTLQAELLELKAPVEGSAKGVVIEASLDRGRGSVATVLVQSGTLRKGDIVVCGTEFGRVRAMFNEVGEQVETAGPSIPVQILGLSGVPGAGDEVVGAVDDKAARELADFRQQRERDVRLASNSPAKLEDVFSQIQSGDRSTLNLMVKTDVQGSLEAIRDAMVKMSTDEITIRVIGGGVGGINESDAQLAAASNAILIGFNVRADSAARRIIQEKGVDLHYHSVIYAAIDMVKAAAGGMLSPEIQEKIIGLAQVKEVFRSPKFGDIAGSMVIEGVIRKAEPIRVLRDNVVIYEGELESLRRFKDDVSEVRMGTECGIGVKNYKDVRPGDQIEVFERREIARTL